MSGFFSVALPVHAPEDLSHKLLDTLPSYFPLPSPHCISAWHMEGLALERTSLAIEERCWDKMEGPKYIRATCSLFTVLIKKPTWARDHLMCWLFVILGYNCTQWLWIQFISISMFCEKHQGGYQTDPRLPGIYSVHGRAMSSSLMLNFFHAHSHACRGSTKISRSSKTPSPLRSVGSSEPRTVAYPFQPSLLVIFRTCPGIWNHAHFPLLECMLWLDRI